MADDAKNVFCMLTLYSVCMLLKGEHVSFLEK